MCMKINAKILAMGFESVVANEKNNWRSYKKKISFQGHIYTLSICSINKKFDFSFSAPTSSTGYVYKAATLSKIKRIIKSMFDHET